MKASRSDRPRKIGRALLRGPETSRLETLWTVVVVLATAVWLVLLALVLAGVTTFGSTLAVLLILPAGLLVLRVFGLGSATRVETLSIALTAVLLVAAVSAVILEASPELVAVPPVLLVSALLCHRFPAAAVVLLFAVSGTFGAIRAFTGISPALIADLIIAGLWLSILGGMVLGRRASSPSPPWLSLVALAGYLAITAFGTLASDDLSIGLQGFRAQAWYMSVILIPFAAGWGRETYRRIAAGVVVVVAATCSYAILRWIIGPAEAERELALQVAGPFNFVEGRFRVFGATAGGHQLGLWAAVSIPIAIGAVIATTGRWRALSWALLAAAILTMMVSEVRGTFAATVVAVLAMIGLIALSRGLGRPKLQIVVGSLAAVVLLGGAAIALTAADTGSTDRYTELLTPGDAQGLKDRQFKWNAALDELEGSIFGKGIGTGGRVQQERGTVINAASRSLDNSYIKVAFEQGFPVLALFVLALLMLLADLVRSTVMATEPRTLGYMLGAAGVTVSMLVSMYSGLYVEDLLALSAWIPMGCAAGYWLSGAATSRQPDPQRVRIRPSGPAVAQPG